MGDMLDKVTMEMLRGDQRELAETIGLVAYIHLVRLCGGCHLYIAKRDKLESAFRDDAVFKDFNGYNYDKLALKYGLSEQTVRDIVKKRLSAAEQICFYDF